MFHKLESDGLHIKYLTALPYLCADIRKSVRDTVCTKPGSPCSSA